MDAQLGKAFYVRLHLRNSETTALRPSPVPKRDGNTSGVAPDQAPSQGRGPAPVPPPAPSSDESAKGVLLGDAVVVRDGIDPEPLRTDVPFAPRPPKLRKRRASPDVPVSNEMLGAIIAATLMASFALAAVIPSILSRTVVGSATNVEAPAQPDSVAQPETSPEPAPPPAEIVQSVPAQPVADTGTPPVSPPQNAQSVAKQPAANAGAPVPPPQTAQSVAKQPATNPVTSVPVPSRPAPAAGNSQPVANTASVSNQTKSSVQSEKQAVGRSEGAAVPGAATPATPTALTSAEKAAVDRGRQELEKAAPRVAAPRPAPVRNARNALTAEEKAAIERGLRELEKAPRP